MGGRFLFFWWGRGRRGGRAAKGSGDGRGGRGVRSGSVRDIRRPFQGCGSGSWDLIMALDVMVRWLRRSWRRRGRRWVQLVGRRRGGISNVMVEAMCERLLVWWRLLKVGGRPLYAEWRFGREEGWEGSAD